MAKITYANKTALNPQPSISAENKVTDSDMNEIKSSVNDLYDEVDSIIDSGSNANGNYIKYSDGTMICYKNVTGTANISSSWGSGYYGGDGASISLGNFAQTFTSTPIINVTAERTDGNYWIGCIQNASSSSAGNIYLLRFSSNASNPYSLNIVAIGKWK